MWGLVFVCAAVCLMQHWCPEPEPNAALYQRVAESLGNRRGIGAGNVRPTVDSTCCCRPGRVAGLTDSDNAKAHPSAVSAPAITGAAPAGSCAGIDPAPAPAWRSRS